MGGNEEDSAKLFSVVPGDRTRSNMHKLKDLTFHPSTKKCFFIARVDRYCNRLPKEIVESPSLDILKTNWTWLWTTFPGDPASSREVGPDNL